MSVESVVSKSKRKNIGDKTENENTLAETEGLEGEGNDMDYMCREEMRRVGAAQTGEVTQARGVAWAGDASKVAWMGDALKVAWRGAAMPILTASAGHCSKHRQECQC